MAMIAAGNAALPVRAEVELIEHEVRYVVDGVTVKELGGQLAGSSAWHSQDGGSAATDALIESRYRLQPREDGRCGIEDVRLTVTLTTTLPEWRPRRKVDPELDANMKRVVEGLAVHERGHRDLVLAAAADVEQQFAGLQAEATCTLMMLEAEDTLRRAIMRLRGRHMRYDHATRRGELQGAVLQPREIPTRNDGSGTRAR